MHRRPTDTRAVEALLTTMLTNLGVVYLSPGQLFLLQHYEILATMISEIQFGFLCIIIGTLRGLAVIQDYILFRVVGSVASITFWILLALSLFASTNGAGLPALFAISMSAAAFEVFCIVKIWLDIWLPPESPSFEETNNMVTENDGRDR